MIAVADRGGGWSRATRERDFEPFFTTKGVGKGTGLGLSQAYGFAKQSGGTAVVRSAPGRGTAVTLYLPETGEPVERPRTDARPDEPIATSDGNGTVLVVE